MATFRNLTDTFTRNIERAIDQALDDNYLKGVGRDTVRQIQVRTRSGFGVASNGASQRRLRPLSSQYVEARRFARSLGILSETTTPQRSNLTFSGNMLESINYRVNNRRIMFGFSNQRAEDVAEEVQSRGRPFFNLSNTEIRNLTRQFNSRLRGFLIRV